MKVGDLISLPPIRTVVQLADLQNPAERSRLADHFVLTGEALFGLRIILQQVLRGEGCGFFLKGHYGSGKSHFLAYLSLVLSEGPVLEAFLRDFEAQDVSSALALSGLSSRKPAVLTISLVDYRSSTPLEDVVAETLLHRFPGAAEAIGAGARKDGRHGRGKAAASSRKAFFERAFQLLEERGYGGLVILIDEVSEFLRSKPSVPEFNEDVRFLQFLGEFSSGRPLWLVAALQEYLEETGEINQESFNKIKDRYPLRIVLTAAHVKELVSRLLVRKKPESRKVIGDLYRRFKGSFPGWPVAEEEFAALYPVHPASIELLEDLKPLFSKTRGFVDFVHYQIAGNPERGIAGMLDRPCETLLCPDRIFDHFLDRMTSTLELVPYVETVYMHYRREMPRILETEEDRRFALRLVKLLILQDISPARRSFTARQLAEMLVERITDLDPEVNYQFTADVAAELLRRGGFLTASSAPGEEDDPLGRVYHIRLEADAHSILERKLEYRSQALAALGRQAATRLFACALPRLSFFAELRPATAELFLADWQNTRRHGILRVCGTDGSLPESPESSLQESEFELIVLLPGQEPGLTGEGAAEGTGVLLPGPVEEVERCRDALALFLLEEEYREDHSSQGTRVRELLEQRLEEQLPWIASVYQAAFQEARLCSPSGEVVYVFGGVPLTRSFELFQEAAARLLEARFPKHYLIAPQQNYYPQAALDELVPYFQSMSAESFERLRWGRTILEGFLLPTGLLKRQRRDYVFASGAEESGPLEWLLGRIKDGGKKVTAREALRVLARSPFGMSELQAKAFLPAALFGGFLVGLRQDRRVALTQLEAGRLMEIDELRPGETVGREAAGILSRLDWVPKKLRKPGLSYAECQQCWEAVRAAHREAERKLQETEQLLKRYREYGAFRLLRREKMGRTLEELKGLLDGVRTSYAPVEGLETFAAGLAAFGGPRQFNEALRSLDHLYGFFTESFAAFLFMAGYLEQAAGLLPEEPRYAAPAEAYGRLRSGLEGWDPCGEPQRFHALQEEFEAWQRMYAGLYQEEHQAFHASPGFTELEDFLRNPDLRLLERLEQLEAFVPTRTSASLRGEIQKLAAGRCGRPVWEELQRRPLCGCGFRPGDRPQLPSPRVFAEVTEGQLRQFLAQLQHPRFQELLDRFEYHLARQKADRKLEGRMSAGDVLALTRRLKGISTPDGLRLLGPDLSRELVAHLNRFEPGRKPFQVKALSSFQQRAGSEPRTRAGWVREFDRWLGEGLSDPDQPIRLVQQTPAEGDTVREAVHSLVMARAPQLREALERLTPEEFLFRLLASELVERHQVPHAEARRLLPLFPEAREVSLYARIAAALGREEPDWYREAREAFESRLDESAFAALGLLGDSPLQLARILEREMSFASLVRHAAVRILKNLAHADLRTVEAVRTTLEGEDTPSGDGKDRISQYRALVQAFLWVRQAEHHFQQDLEGLFSGRRRSLAAAERFFTQQAALLPYMLDRLRVYLEQLDCRDLLDLSSREKKLCRRLGEFEERYAGGLSSLSDSLPRVEGVAAERGAELASRLQPSSTRLLFVDCLSWPLWKLLSQRLLRRMPARLRLVGEEIAYAREPSTTLEQMQRWLEAGGPLVEGKLQKGFDFPERSGAGVHRIDWVDEKIHTSRESLYFLSEEVVEQLMAQLLLILGGLPGRTLLVLFSDHGFVENPAFLPQDKYRFPRYRHGGGSPFELAVPVAFLFSGSTPAGLG